jgi:hypothetical protein
MAALRYESSPIAPPRPLSLFLWASYISLAS